MNIAEWLARAAKASPEAPAVLWGTESLWNYDALTARVSSLAAGLMEREGIRPGDRVGIWMANRPEYLVCLQAIHWAGAVAVPINAKLHRDEAAWILADAEARVAFTDGTRAGDCRHLDVCGGDLQNLSSCSRSEPPVARNSDDLAWLFYTSGTTGRSKGVMLTHGNLIAMTLSYLVDVEDVRPQDVAVYAAPMSHGAGLYNYAHVLRASRHLFPKSGGFNAEELLDLAAAIGDLSMFAAPTMVRRLVDAARRRQYDGSGFRTIVYGGGPMYLADIEVALEILGQRFVQIYGQGESPMTITVLPREAHSGQTGLRKRLASVGRPHSVVEVRIANPSGEALPCGRDGEIEVRGPTVMAGYWRNEEATQQAIRGGWLRTGDIGRFDEEGHLTLTDRLKDVIISGGSNIYPREVEEVLLTHPRVSEAAVVGEADAEWGERVVAFVVGAGEPVPDAELDALCLSRLARFKRPRRYIQAVELPKNNYGKILRAELRKRLRSCG